MRIVKTRYKILFIAAWLVVLGVASWLLPEAGLTVVSDWLSILGFAAMTVIAVRVFRVREEDIVAPRPYWRLTGRPTAGFLLGGLNALSAASAVWSMIYTSSVANPSAEAALFAAPGTLPVQIVSIVIDAAFGFLYLRSSFRLARRVPAPGLAH